MSLCKETRISAKLACALSWHKAIMLCLKYHVYIICIYNIYRLQTQLSSLHTDDVWRTGKAPLAAKQRLKGVARQSSLAWWKYCRMTSGGCTPMLQLAWMLSWQAGSLTPNSECTGMGKWFETASASSGVPLRSDKACISQPSWLASLGSLASSMQVS